MAKRKTKSTNTKAAGAKLRSEPRVRLIKECQLERLSVRRAAPSSTGSRTAVHRCPVQAKQGEIFGGRYRLLEQLTPGGMSQAIWTAHDIETGDDRVLKFLPSNTAIHEEAEFRVLRQLTHTSICRLWDVIQDPPTLVLEHVHGRDLARFIREANWQSRHPEDRLKWLMRIVRQIASALDHSHHFKIDAAGRIERCGVVHLDIKPSNIFVVDGDDDSIAKLGDFGLGRVLGENITAPGGTIPYMPPEQIVRFLDGDIPLELTDASIGPSTDVHSLAATVYECLTGEPLISGNSPRKCCEQILNLDPSRIRIEGIPEKSNRAIQAALSRLPDERPESAGVFAKRLDPELRITTANLPDGHLENNYRCSVRCEGGTPPYRWWWTSPSEIKGLECSSTGEIFGFPYSEDGHERKVRLELHVEDAGGEHRDSRVFSFHVRPRGSLALVTHSLPAVLTGNDFSVRLRCRGGKPPYRWSLAGQPPAIACDDSGMIAGRFSEPLGERKRIRVTLQDQSGARREHTLNLAVLGSGEYSAVEGGEYEVGLQPDEVIRLAKKLRVTQGMLADRLGNGTVRLGKFAIKKRPVSNREYREFVLAEGHAAPPNWRKGKYPFGTGNTPVTSVSLADAGAYCRWRGTRLPSAAEWETALRHEVISAKKANCEWVDSRVPLAGRANHKERALPITANSRVACSSEADVDWNQLRAGTATRFGLFLTSDSEPGEMSSSFSTCGDRLTTFRDVADLTSVERPTQQMVRIASGWFCSGPEDQQTHLPDFEIARYAVSNLDYAEFHQDYWNQPWTNFRAEDALLPATNISFDDAKAFCDWMTRRDPDGFTYLLPNVLQWERAARGPGGQRHYPWGDRYDHLRCNSLESGNGRPVRVFDYVQGQTAEGCFNMCGNVSEWVTKDGQPVTMGGNWLSTCKHFGRPHCCMRFPETGHPLVGFRFVRRANNR